MTANSVCCRVLLFQFLLLFTAILARTGNQSTQRSGYEEPCNKTLKCRSQSWLGCDSTTQKCLCVKPDEMMYDPSRQKCVAQIGERCKFGFDGDSEEEVSGRGLWYEKADCVMGAVCGPSGLCSCPVGTYEDPDLSQCSQVKTYGRRCLSKVECDESKFLSCVNGLCGCDPDTAIYNNNSFSHNYRSYYTVPKGVCVGRIGSFCSQHLKKYCAPNAYCDESASNLCHCQSGFTPTSDFLCGLGYDQPCSASSICSDHLVCSSKIEPRSYSSRNQYGIYQDVHTTSKCKCPNQSYQYYDTGTKSCRGRVGSPCNPSDANNTCTPKSICTERNGMFTCECDIGFVVTVKQTCQIEYGKECNYKSSGMGMHEMCDERPGLECKDGKCQCPDQVQMYEAERRLCSSPVGLTCFESKQCLKNSFCKESDFGEEFAGRCECKEGFVRKRNHTCGVESDALSEGESNEDQLELGLTKESVSNTEEE